MNRKKTKNYLWPAMQKTKVTVFLRDLLRNVQGKNKNVPINLKFCKLKGIFEKGKALV